MKSVGHALVAKIRQTDEHLGMSIRRLVDGLDFLHGHGTAGHVHLAAVALLVVLAFAREFESGLRVCSLRCGPWSIRCRN